jgi:hypothetical protein
VRLGAPIECFARQRRLAARVVAEGAVSTSAPSIFGDGFAGMASTGWDRHASVKEIIGQGPFLHFPDARKLNATVLTASIVNITIDLAVHSDFIVSLTHEGNIVSTHAPPPKGRARS